MSKNGVAQCLTILQKYSDVNHPLSTEEIIDLFNKNNNNNNNDQPKVLED